MCLGAGDGAEERGLVAAERDVIFTSHFDIFTLHLNIFTSHFNIFTIHFNIFTSHFNIFTSYFNIFTSHFTDLGAGNSAEEGGLVAAERDVVEEVEPLRLEGRRAPNVRRRPCAIQKSMSLKYEPASEPLHIPVK